MIIERAIIHILGKESLIINEKELELDKDIISFIERMIVKLINSTQSRNCKFEDWDNNELRYAINAVLNNEYEFVEYSKIMAIKLYESMVEKNSDLSNDFLIVKYRVHDEHYIAGICLNYKESYESETKVIDDKVTININKNNISYAENQLLKYGFSCGKTWSKDRKWDLITLDRPEEKTESDSAFIKIFIKGTKVDDSKYLTNKFINLAKRWINSNLSTDIYNYFKAIEALSSLIDCDDEDVISIESFCYTAFSDEFKRNAFMILLKTNNVPDEFKVNKKIITNKLRKMKFKTNQGIDIEMRAKDFSSSKFKVTNNENGEYSILFNAYYIYQ